jgi:uncharacterized protein with HEPN domain
MPPDDRDMAHLWDMLDNAQAAIEFVSGREYSDLENDRMFRNAVERSLEIIGEAARRTSDTTRDAHPEIRWRSMIGLRNILAHEYDQVRYEIVWRICQEELPKLVQHLRSIGVEYPPDSPET